MFKLVKTAVYGYLVSYGANTAAHSSEQLMEKLGDQLETCSDYAIERAMCNDLGVSESCGTYGALWDALSEENQQYCEQLIEAEPLHLEVEYQTDFNAMVDGQHASHAETKKSMTMPIDCLTLEEMDLCGEYMDKKIDCESDATNKQACASYPGFLAKIPAKKQAACTSMSRLADEAIQESVDNIKIGLN